MPSEMEIEAENSIAPADRRFEFGQEIDLSQSGFSFRQIAGFELEIDGSVYLYSDDGNVEVSLIGGRLDPDTSIAALNNTLAEEFLSNLDRFSLSEEGTARIQHVTGFVNAIQFVNAEEEGLGRALICSPYLNQFFFMLVISSAECWHTQGEPLFNSLRDEIRFSPAFLPQAPVEEHTHHPDLTIETFSQLDTEDDLILWIEKGDLSLLLSAQSADPTDTVVLTGIQNPAGKWLYRYDPQGDTLTSEIIDHPIRGDHGELCFFFPRDNQNILQAGTYRFSFATHHNRPLETVQVLIRTGRAQSLQAFDLNLWISAEDPTFDDPDHLATFVQTLRQQLTLQLAPFNLIPGRIEVYQPAPDEGSLFEAIEIDRDLADCSYMIVDSVQQLRALHIGIVKRIFRADAAGEVDLDAVSAGAPGMILSDTSPHACVALAWPHFGGSIVALADAIIRLMVTFSGIATAGQHQTNTPALSLNEELAWRLRRHPLFYNAD